MMDEFTVVVGRTFHRMHWEYIALTVWYLIVTHDGREECRTEVGSIGVGPDGYWGEYNATGERFLSLTKDGARMMVEIAHSTYWRPIQARTMYEMDTAV
jgi:hypothetical protein